jgi:hypothetical protein
VCFIYDDVLERDVNEDSVDILEEDFIAGDEDMELIDRVIMNDCSFGRYISVEPFIGSTGGSPFCS